MGNRNRNKSKSKLSQIGNPTGSNIRGGSKGGGGYGTVQPGTREASGSPRVNPFMQPKFSGQNIGSWVYPSNYYVDWNTSKWREVCDQAVKMGYTQGYATLTSWVFEKSPFVRSLFLKLGAAMDRVKFYVNDKDGNEIPELTKELCSKLWQMKMRREILYSYFWGFSGLNFDPIAGKCYKYPMQQIDPINRMLKANTFSFYEGELFDSSDNLLFVQPSDNYEEFLGWMQAISCSFIEMNVNSNNWVAAGRRLAFPLLTVGYPQDDGSLGEDGKPKNNYKADAIALATDIDPTNGLVYPYTIDNDGNIIKSIEIEFEKTGASANTHKIYQEFNNDQKAEIQEMVLGRSTTNASGKGGNRALGEVEEEALDDRVAELMPFVLAILNDEFKTKISKFYKNLPKGWEYAYGDTKKLTPEQIESLSKAINENGFNLTTEFFVAQGLSIDYFEKASPVVSKTTTQQPQPDFQMAEKKKPYF